MHAEVRMIDDAVVAAMLPHTRLVETMAGAFIDPPRTPPRMVVDLAGADGERRIVLTMPSVRRDGIAITKIVTVSGGGSRALRSQVFVHDRRGELMAVVAGHELTARRTAAASVLAARALMSGTPRSLAILGAGKQAHALLAAYLACLPIADVRIWARRDEPAQILRAASVAAGVHASVFATAAAAVAGADIISCATMAESPLFAGTDVAAGAHVDLVGGFRPAMREADDLLITRGTVVTDGPVALVEAGDLAQPIAAGLLEARSVLQLSDVLVRPGALARRGDVTVFKSVGHAAEDLVAVELLLRGIGMLEQPE